MTVRHFLDLSALSAADLCALLAAAHARKAARAGRPKGAPDDDAPLASHTLAMIFEKASTRTRVSFDMAMRQLGGSAIVMSAADMQLGRGETVEDTAQVLSRMVDAVMIRANRHADIAAFAAASAIPVINGLSDKSHPCQVLADLMTIEERVGGLDGCKVAWLGDGNNVCRSFIHAAARLGFELQIAAPDGYAPDLAAECTGLTSLAGRLSVTDNPAAAARGADVVVTDTWVSMGDLDAAARKAALAPYQVTPALMSLARPQAIFLHCLPAHRGEEVIAGVIDGPQSAVLDAAENRIHAQKAVLLWCLLGA
jgi:ornithine carbamoyltransferase